MSTAPFPASPLLDEERRIVALRSDLGRAWIGTVLILPVFFLAFGSGYLISWLIGADGQDGELAWWQAAVIVVPTVVILLIPCAAAAFYGNRARRGGLALGWVPLVAGLVIGTWWTVINVASAVATVTRGIP